MKKYELTQKEEKALLDNRQAFKEKYIKEGHSTILNCVLQMYILLII